MGAWSKAEIQTQVMSALEEVSPGVDASAINPGAPFRDQIALDSVDFLRFVRNVSDRLGIVVSGLDYPRLSSLRGALEYLEERLHDANP